MAREVLLHGVLLPGRQFRLPLAPFDAAHRSKDRRLLVDNLQLLQDARIEERPLGQANGSVRDLAAADTADPVRARGQEALRHMTMVHHPEEDDHVAVEDSALLPEDAFHPVALPRHEGDDLELDRCH